MAEIDLRRLRGGELLTGACAAGLLVVMFVDWFGGSSAWEALAVGRFVLVALVLGAAAVVVTTVTSRTAAMACAAGVITAGVGIIALALVGYRVAIDEPGANASVTVDGGAYLGLLLVIGVAAGAWRTLADERTESAASLEQTERVLAVRGAPRKAPLERDPERPPQSQ